MPCGEGEIHADNGKVHESNEHVLYHSYSEFFVPYLPSKMKGLFFSVWPHPLIMPQHSNISWKQVNTTPPKLKNLRYTSKM